MNERLKSFILPTILKCMFSLVQIIKIQNVNINVKKELKRNTWGKNSKLKSFNS